MFCSFATCSNENARIKIRKRREINDYNDIKKMEKIKSWKTQSVKHKVALVLIADGVSFSYTETDGRLVPETNGMSANADMRGVAARASGW